MTRAQVIRCHPILLGSFHEARQYFRRASCFMFRGCVDARLTGCSQPRNFFNYKCNPMSLPLNHSPTFNEFRKSLRKEERVTLSWFVVLLHAAKFNCVSYLPRGDRIFSQRARGVLFCRICSFNCYVPCPCQSLSV